MRPENINIHPDIAIGIINDSAIVSILGEKCLDPNIEQPFYLLIIDGLQ